MKLNRKLQFDVLNALQEVYPDSLLVSALPHFSHESEFMGNLFYLQEHELIVGGDIREPGQCRSMVDAQITKSGLDFIADDGGLAAIFEGVTLKFQRSEILDVLEECLSEINIDKVELAALKNTMEHMDVERFKKIVLQLLKSGGQTMSEVVLSFADSE